MREKKKKKKRRRRRKRSRNKMKKKQKESKMKKRLTTIQKPATTFCQIGWRVPFRYKGHRYRHSIQCN